MNAPLPDPACRHGFTDEQLAEIIGPWDSPERDKFERWMAGQTGLLCDGWRYTHESREHVRGCEQAHGRITFTWDVEAYLRGHPPLD